MKKILLIPAIIGFSLLGCHEKENLKAGRTQNRFQRADCRSSDFPPELAGTWKNLKQGWEITIDPNGQVLEIVSFSLGKVRLKSDQVQTITNPDGQSERIYEPAEWVAEYAPEDSQLYVDLAFSRLFFPIGENRFIQGTLLDRFYGKVDPEKGVWDAYWISYPDYYLYNPEPQKIQNQPDILPTELEFYRIQR